MKNYRVRLSYHTNVEVNVCAENENEAIENARQYASRDDNDVIDIILGGLVEDSSPDVEEIK